MIKRFQDVTNHDSGLTIGEESPGFGFSSGRHNMVEEFAFDVNGSVKRWLWLDFV